MTDDKEITVAEAAAILNASRQTVWTMIKRGSIKARMIKIDPTTTKGEYRIKQSEIKRIKELQNKQ